MCASLHPPLTARRGQVLQVLGIARISTVHQDELSLADQEALYRSYLKTHTDLPFNLKMIAGRGSGERLDRKEAREARTQVETGMYDLVIAEDLGRIFRRVHAYLFCEKCEDNGTRLITVNDHVDTARPGWRLNAFFASVHHEMFVSETADRIRRTLRNRFKEGGVVQTTVFGIVKPAGAKKDADLYKDPAAQPIYDEMVHRLENGASYSEVADWLNETKVPLPPFARSARWTCGLVTQLIHNPMLKGVRVRNRKMSVRVNETGHHKSVKAPPHELLERNCPHLAFIDPERYDRLIQTLDERNARYKRKGVNGIDPRSNVPMKRTIWPGQHIYCGICGRMYVYGGHGQKDHLMCRGAHAYQCWNGITVDGPLAAENMIAAIRAMITSLPDYDPVLLAQIEEELRQQQDDTGQRVQELTRRLHTVDRQLRNVLDALKAAGSSDTLIEELKRLEGEKKQIHWDQQQIVKVRQAAPTVPPLAELKDLANKSFETLARESPEFGRLLRRLIPRIVVYPYRLCDGGHPVLRAHFELCLLPLLPGAPGGERLAGALQRSLVVDLFDPPQREAYRVPIMELTANRLDQRSIAWELEITQTAVQHAVRLGRKMEALGIGDPYLPMNAPPDDYDRMQRHKHSRYRFEPLVSEGNLPPLSST
jgi:site-specific DNA recombinase